MKRVFVLAALTAALLACGLLIGCSDDDDETNPVITGDLNDSNYVFFDDYAADLGSAPAQFTLMSVFGFIQYLQTRKDAGDTNEEIVIFNYSYANGWHIADFTINIVDTVDDVIETLVIAGTDSLQAWVDGGVVETPENQPDSIKVRSHFDVGMNNSDGDYASARVHQVFTMKAVVLATPGDEYRIDGFGADTLTTYFTDDSSNTCNIHVEIATVYNGITINETAMENGDCPSSGTMTNTIDLELSCSSATSPLGSLEVDGIWIVTESFNGTTGTRTVTFGDVVWTETFNCN